MQTHRHDWDFGLCAHIFQFLTWYSWCPCLVDHLWIVRFCQKTLLIAWIVDTTEVSWLSGELFALLASCVGSPCLVESIHVLGFEIGNFEVHLIKGSFGGTLCSFFLILLLALMLPSPLPRGGVLLGTLCMGVYLAMCLCNGLFEPYVYIKRDACCTCYDVHDALGTQVVWRTIRVKWLLLERTPPAIHCFVKGKAGYFACNMLSTGWGYPCIVST